MFDAVVEDDNAETPDVSYHVNEEGTGVFSFRLSRGTAGSEGAPGKDGKDGITPQLKIEDGFIFYKRQKDNQNIYVYTNNSSKKYLL